MKIFFELNCKKLFFAQNREDKRKSRADIRLAFDPDKASVRFYELFCNRKSEPCAAVFPVKRIFNLLEFVKNFNNILGRNPNPAVRHGNFYVIFVKNRILEVENFRFIDLFERDCFCFYDNFPVFVCEFYGV